MLVAFTVYLATTLILRPLGEEHPALMSQTRKILLGARRRYLRLIVAFVVIFGSTRGDNEEFQPQNEFKLDTWIDLPGPFDINKAVALPRDRRRS